MKKTITILALLGVAVFAQQQGTLTDSRDGKKYKTVKIGTQTWMAQNLNYSKSGNCYDNKPANCEKYGRLYDGKTAETACPSDWHLPSRDEWSELLRAVDDNDDAGVKLKSKNGWPDSIVNGKSRSFAPESFKGKDTYGFAGLPGGYFNESDGFEEIEKVGFWWTGTATRGNSKIYFRMDWDAKSAEYSTDGTGKISNLLSIRCIKNVAEAKNTKEEPQKQAETAVVKSNDKNLPTFTDSRDGKKYKYVKIGKQTWMAENLNYNVDKKSICYDDKPENCEKYGRFYLLPPNKKGSFDVCPSGWHLPSKNEWWELFSFAGSWTVNAKKLKSKSGWNWDNSENKSSNGTDDFGFEALPSGECVASSNGVSCKNIGNIAIWAKLGSFGYDYVGVISTDEGIRSADDRGSIRIYDSYGHTLANVRCVQD